MYGRLASSAVSHLVPGPVGRGLNRSYCGLLLYDSEIGDEPDRPACKRCLKREAADR